jgi:hypothetical protein
MKYKRGDIIFFFNKRRGKTITEPFSVDMVIGNSFREPKKYIIESLTEYDDEETDNEKILACAPLSSKVALSIRMLHWEE